LIVFHFLPETLVPDGLPDRANDLYAHDGFAVALTAALARNVEAAEVTAALVVTAGTLR
jgi:hypothetical protein